MDAVATLRRPEYTGPNRCWPCTAVNVGILGVIVAALAFLAPLPVAATVAVLGLAVVWLRGYLVPFTPRFAPRLVAWLPGDLFAHDTSSDSLGNLGTADTDGEAVLKALVDAGVVEVQGEQLGLSAAFAGTWRERMDALAAADDGPLAAAAERDVDGVASARIEASGEETYLVVTGEDGSTAWIRRPVALAELGAAQALAGTDRPVETRDLAAHALLAFLETCPACGADVVEGPADDCCGNAVPAPGHEAPQVLACEDCGVAFYTLEPADGGPS